MRALIYLLITNLLIHLYRLYHIIKLFNNNRWGSYLYVLLRELELFIGAVLNSYWNLIKIIYWHF